MIERASARHPCSGARTVDPMKMVCGIMMWLVELSFRVLCGISNMQKSYKKKYCIRILQTTNIVWHAMCHASS